MSDSNQNNELNRHQTHQQPSPSAARSSARGEQSAPIAEQEPTMQYVAINPLTQRGRAIHSEQLLRRVDPGGPAQLRSLREVSQPELFKSPSPKFQLPARSKSLSHLPTKWHVEHAALAARPADFPPLRTSRTVLGTPANVISNRVSDCLQDRSIRTKYSKSRDNVAKCRNTDFCKFTIRLYSSDDGGVLVEIQRLCGDAVSFMKDCRAVLNAAEGKPVDRSSQEETPMYLRLPVSQMEFVKKISLPPISVEEQADNVNVTADLLSSHQSDSNMLGMESLVIQTDPLKTMKSTAILASRRILCPNDPGNKAFNMHNYVMSLLIYDDAHYSSSESEDTAAFEDHPVKLRNLAMSALCNALALFSSEKLLLTTISSSQEWYTSVLIPKLVQDLSTAEDHPHDACFASRCLSTLAGANMEFAIKMKESGGRDAIEIAEQVGLREFAMLARDVECCHNILKCCS
mmetsp:Transcript_17854/g.42963  ORF Transcript_17854/g.42963 Transcript_17854/m.42963 type:complete len:460 (+) Transcript_17854:278-1657(+)|eukprot:CAMPEP_0181088010 /NCGR_PEP_ID=MMETSP1071-20121207/6564_1 /TAXON_ID=35127 /ORGANISM="Thalassiosira sp., Strain NH16" /LENGTH=459 /DNA_ID=CAMNT_0023169909 /DNA_START=274 /DNA_END=1653 /DNA_ORIENTATION=-